MMTSEERQAVYAVIPVTTVFRCGDWYYVFCEGVMRFLPAGKRRRNQS